MIFYTTQSIKKWNYANKIGYLEGEKQYISNTRIDVYSWMMKQMKKRLSKYNDEYPIWLFTKESYLKRHKDLNIKEGYVLLQVDIPKKDVLLSNTEAYQLVYNNQPLYLGNEFELIEEGILNMTKEQSWEHIFDLELLKNSDKELYKSDDDIQGVTGRIELQNIKRYNFSN